MKVLKGLAITFILSVTAACVGVQADDYFGLIGIKIPTAQTVYTTAGIYKSNETHQFVKTNGTTGNRGVRARVQDIYGDLGSYHTLSIGGCTQVTGSDGVGVLSGYYHLKMQTTSFHITDTEYTGTWILNGNYKNQIC